MRISDKPWFRSAQQQREMDALVAHLRAKYPPKPRPVKPEGMSQEDFILSLQQPSTFRVLKMTEEEAEIHRNRPMPTNWKAVEFEGDFAKLSEAEQDRVTNTRKLTPAEIDQFRATRINNSLGQSTESATTPELRDRAISAIVYTPGADVTKQEVDARAVNLVQYKSEPMQEVWVEIPWWKALLHKLRGNKIRSESHK